MGKSGGVEEAKGEASGNGLNSRDRPALGRIAGYLGFADLMAVMMVFATGFSAIATWRTASIAEALYQTSQRPYFGVQHVEIDRSKAGIPRVSVEYRNFGDVPAAHTKIHELLYVDGKPIGDGGASIDAGILSPKVPHFVRAHLPPEFRDTVTSGKSELKVEVSASYYGSTSRRLCYRERFIYIPETESFEVDGGSQQCSR